MAQAVLTIGNFDGVHLGHQRILSVCRAAAADQGGGAVIVLTFDPPPVALLRPAEAPPALCPLAERQRRLCSAGADDVIVLQPTREMLSQSPETFVAQLVSAYGPGVIVEGADFRFGRSRAGDMLALAELGRRHGFAVRRVPEQRVGLSNGVEAPVRSTLVRSLVGQARLLDAARCLGQPYALYGEVVRGEQRGRTIGIPTANLDPGAYARCLLPPDGVYAGQARIKGELQPHAAAISIGQKPTFHGRQLTVEAHLLDYAPGDPDGLYGRHIELGFARWIRDQYPFPNVGELTAQLQRDIRRVREWHQTGLLDPQKAPAA